MKLTYFSGIAAFTYSVAVGYTDFGTAARSLMTSPAMISPTTDGTKALLAGICLRGESEASSCMICAIASGIKFD